MLFAGVAGGELHAFQDVWMPNHEQLLSEVDNDVEHLEPWYEGETTFGLAVPSYMKGVDSISDLNQSGAERIIGIKPGAVISTKIEQNVIPEYNLNLEHEPSSTASMLAKVERALQGQRTLRVLAVVSAPDVWSSLWVGSMGVAPETCRGCTTSATSKDPKNSLGNLDEPAKISSIVNEDLPGR